MTSTDPGDDARSILAAQRCQTSLPLTAMPSPGTTTTGVSRAPGHVSLPAAPVVPLLGLVVILVALAIGLAWLIKHLMPPRLPAAPPKLPASEPAAAARPLGDAEALAHQGRFAEAIHTLLLRALAELGRRKGSLAASQAATSREVLRHAGVPAAVKTALAPLVTAVEWMYFGRAPAGASDYAACAEHYRRFREAWQASR